MPCRAGVGVRKAVGGYPRARQGVYGERGCAWRKRGRAGAWESRWRQQWPRCDTSVVRGRGERARRRPVSTAIEEQERAGAAGWVWAADLHKGRVDDFRLERIKVDLPRGDLALEEGVELARLLVDVECGPLDNLDLREQLVHRARHHRLGRATAPRDDDAANLWVDRTEQQCGLDGLLSHDAGERENSRPRLKVDHGGATRGRPLRSLHIRIHLLDHEPRTLRGVTGGGGAHDGPRAHASSAGARYSGSAGREPDGARAAEQQRRQPCAARGTDLHREARLR